MALNRNLAWNDNSLLLPTVKYPNGHIQDLKVEINKTLLAILNLGNPSNQKQFRLQKKNSDS